MMTTLIFVIARLAEKREEGKDKCTAECFILDVMR